MGEMVELADSKKLFHNPAHPYTKTLFAAAFLDPEGVNPKRLLLPEEVACPLNPPPGCRFNPRCSRPHLFAGMLNLISEILEADAKLFATT